jgi:16S rRNA processing protein RimM
MSNAATPVAPADLVELGRIAAAYGVKGWVKIQPHSADADVLLSVASASSGKSSPSSSGSTHAPPSASLPASTWWLVRAPLPGASTAVGKSSPAQPYAVKAARHHGSHIVAQLDGIDDRDQAEALRGMGVCVSRSVFPAPGEDEYYWVDLIGCTVFGDDNGAAALLGVVDEVLDNGAHAVLKVLRQRDPGQGQCAAASGPSQGSQAGQGAELMLDPKGRPLEVLVPFVQAHIRAVDLANRRIDSDWPLDF